MHVRRGLAALAAVLGVTVQPAVADASTACSVVPLDVPPGTSGGAVSAAGAPGVFVGNMGAGDGFGVDMVVWTDGVPTDVTTTFGLQEDQPRATDINRHGAIVGATHNFFTGDRDRAFVFRDGALQLLPEPEGTIESRAEGINDNGDVVGQVADSSNVLRPVVWPAAEPGTVRLLGGVPDGLSVFAAGIDEQGRIAGRSSFDPADGFLWSLDGTLVHRLPPLDAGARSVVLGVVDGRAFGFEQIDGNDRAIVWDLDGVPSLLSKGDNARVTAVDPDGVAVGFTGLGAVWWNHGARLSLPAITTEGPLTEALAVGDDGTIAGQSSNGQTTVPVVWPCRMGS